MSNLSAFNTLGFPQFLLSFGTILANISFLVTMTASLVDIGTGELYFLVFVLLFVLLIFIASIHLG